MLQKGEWRIFVHNSDKIMQRKKNIQTTVFIFDHLFAQSKKKARLYTISSVVQHCCPGCFSVAEAKDADNAGKGGYKKKGRVERRRSVWSLFPDVCSPPRWGFCETMRTSKLVQIFSLWHGYAPFAFARAHGCSNLRRSCVKRQERYWAIRWK